MNGTITLILDSDTNSGNGTTISSTANAANQASVNGTLTNPPSRTYFVYSEYNDNGTIRRGVYGASGATPPGSANYTPGTTSASVTLTLY